MFVCLTARTSVSLLLVSNAAGGEDGTQDDSSLPTWSRKLPNTEQSRSIPFPLFRNVEFGVIDLWGFNMKSGCNVGNRLLCGLQCLLLASNWLLLHRFWTEITQSMTQNFRDVNH